MLGRWGDTLQGPTLAGAPQDPFEAGESGLEQPEVSAESFPLIVVNTSENSKDPAYKSISKAQAGALSLLTKGPGAGRWGSKSLSTGAGVGLRKGWPWRKEAQYGLEGPCPAHVCTPARGRHVFVSW